MTSCDAPPFIRCHYLLHSFPAARGIYSLKLNFPLEPNRLFEFAQPQSGYPLEQGVVEREAGLAEVGKGRVNASMEHRDHVKDDAVHVHNAAAHFILRRGLVTADLVSPPGTLNTIEVNLSG